MIRLEGMAAGSISASLSQLTPLAVQVLSGCAAMPWTATMLPSGQSDVSIRDYGKIVEDHLLNLRLHFSFLGSIENGNAELIGRGFLCGSLTSVIVPLRRHVTPTALRVRDSSCPELTPSFGAFPVGAHIVIERRGWELTGVTEVGLRRSERRGFPIRRGVPSALGRHAHSHFRGSKALSISSSGLG